MLVLSAFDHSIYPPKPLVLSIKEQDKVDIYTLYAKGTKKTLYDVERDLKVISGRINLCKEPIYLNNAKPLIQTLKLTNTNIYHINLQLPSNLDAAKYAKVLQKADIKVKPDKWRNLAAMCSHAYLQMESRPLFVDEQRVYPRYSIDTFTGRSRCTNFNVQGAAEGTPIKTEERDNLFICLDWISADIRVAAYLSEDEYLSECFEKSDPYTWMSEALDLPREECKIAYLQTIYSLNLSSPILELFASLRGWMESQLKILDREGVLKTPLGRPFKISSDRDEKSVFNAVLQGTVAHAMQASLVRMTERLNKYLVTETHDSVVFSSRASLIPHVINTAVQIMIRPLDNFARFPLRVFVGKKWKKWKLYREYR